MALTKSIEERIEAPRLRDVEPKLDIETNSVEVAAQNLTSFTIEAGKYRIIDFSDSTLKKSTLNNVEAFDSMIVRCELEETQATGLSLAQTNFKDVVFKNCRLNLTNFRSSKFLNCAFIDCDLSEADFGMSSIENVSMRNCQLTKTDFSNCDCKNIEFIDCDLSDINGLSGLKSARISELNLIQISPLLAQEFDLEVV